jgi:hypothetical protein
MASITQEQLNKMSQFWTEHVIGEANSAFNNLNEREEVCITMPFGRPNLVYPEIDEEEEDGEEEENSAGVLCRVDTSGNWIQVEPYCRDCEYTRDNCCCEWRGEISTWFQVDKVLYELAFQEIPVAKASTYEGEDMYFLGCEFTTGSYYRSLEPVVDRL